MTDRDRWIGPIPGEEILGPDGECGQRWHAEWCPAYGHADVNDDDDG